MNTTIDYQRFTNACTKGNLKVLEEMDNKSADFRGNAFKEACRKGHLHIIIWLHRVGVDIHVDNDYGLILACLYGHLEIARWLHKHNADIYTGKGKAFLAACQGCHLDIM
jgi:hypothetical protein